MTQEAIENVADEIACRHCVSMPKPHSRQCRCDHSHNDHIYGGGCKLCKCDCYDQRVAAEVPKVKKATTGVVLDVEELEQQLLAGSESLKELTDAQARVDELKEKVASKASSSQAEH